MKIVFWWNIPCTGMINVLKAYVENIDSTAIVVTGALSKSRKLMGWDDKGKIFPTHIILSDDEWEQKGKKIINQYNTRLHVFNGITYPVRIKKMINYACANDVKFCNMSEAYTNLSFGIAKIIKNIYIKYWLPISVCSIAKHSLGVICLSGKSEHNLQQFCNLGFNKNAIFSFGYYTDEDKNYQYVPASDGKVHILCPGLLEKYKGVDILIKAINIVCQMGEKNFVCHITGKGSQEKYLKFLSAQYGLNDGVVIFEGVLDSTKYKTLLSHIDILVAPGRVEPWGIRVNEAIQRGNVVIVSDKIGASELILESKGGAVFHSGNEKELANLLYAFINGNKNIAVAKMHNIEFKSNISCSYQAIVLNNLLMRIAHI